MVAVCSGRSVRRRFPLSDVFARPYRNEATSSAGGSVRLPVVGALPSVAPPSRSRSSPRSTPLRPEASQASFDLRNTRALKREGTE